MGVEACRTNEGSPGARLEANTCTRIETKNDAMEHNPHVEAQDYTLVAPDPKDRITYRIYKPSDELGFRALKNDPNLTAVSIGNEVVFMPKSAASHYCAMDSKSKIVEDKNSLVFSPKQGNLPASARLATQSNYQAAVPRAPGQITTPLPLSVHAGADQTSLPGDPSKKAYVITTKDPIQMMDISAKLNKSGYEGHAIRTAPKPGYPAGQLVTYFVSAQDWGRYNPSPNVATKVR